MPAPPPPQIGVERMIMSLHRTTPPGELRVYATRTHQNGREELRAELDSDTPTEISIYNKDGTLVAVIPLAAGHPTHWPGLDGQGVPTRVGMGGNRSFADTNLSVSL